MDEQSTWQPFTASSLAQAAGVTRSYIARLCRLGELRCTKAGSVWIIQPEDALRWLDSREPEH